MLISRGVRVQPRPSVDEAVGYEEPRRRILLFMARVAVHARNFWATIVNAARKRTPSRRLKVDPPLGSGHRQKFASVTGFPIMEPYGAQEAIF
jgi:hypothetical protein